MRRHRIFVVICILALALGAGYFLHRSAFAGRNTHTDPPVIAQPESKTESATAAQKQSQHRNVASASSAPLPPPGTPLKDIYADLAYRAESGDRAASVRLFHDTAKCRFLAGSLHRLSLLLPGMLHSSKSSNPNLDQTRNSLLADLQNDIDQIKHIEPLCVGLSENESQSSPDWMRLAAEQGDREAIDCYLNLDFVQIGDALRHPQWLMDFQQIAPQMVNRAVTGGDWKAVTLLWMAYDGNGFTNWLAQTIAPNPEQAYRYAYLLKLGGATNSFLEERMKTLESDLTPDTIMAAQDWAGAAFFRDFHSSSTPLDIDTICPNPTTWPD